MSFSTYDLGDLVKVSVVFSDADTGNAFDPDVVSLSVKAPGGTRTTYTFGTALIVKDSTGNYHAELDANAAGTWWYRWFSTGNGQAAEERRFVVRAAQATA